MIDELGIKLKIYDLGILMVIDKVIFKVIEKVKIDKFFLMVGNK